ncbi:MAG: HD domain-containing protein [Lachnospiraceae bacterium]|nr:HD domain-containing protein [Lachnospiraceae bacterium]
MKRINQILELDSYRKYLKKNEKAEEDRKFCHHDMAHFLDVARIAMILNEKEDYGIEEEFIYAAALLHDIGRWKQYKDGTPHEEASAELAPEILAKCGFSPEEISVIVTAISHHRNSKIMDDKDLNGLLYRADKLSRPCFACKEEKNCNWKADKKNMRLVL